MVSHSQALEASQYRSPDLKIFVRDVRDRQARKRAITVRSWSTIKDVKEIIRQTLNVPPSSQRLYYGPLMTSGGELPNYRTLQDAGIYHSGATLLLDITSSSLRGDSDLSSVSCLRTSPDVIVSSSMIDMCPRLLCRIAQQARQGLAVGLKPELSLDGSGGTYVLRDARKVQVAVFKPADEEPYAENNPRGYVKHDAKVHGYQDELSLRAGILPGEACLREVAAYLLDHDGFSGVPMTTLAEARHPTFNTNGAMLKLSEGGASVGVHSLNAQNPSKSSLTKKVGSFQEYVHCECTMDDLSHSMISVEQIHKIAILDIRLMNADRNSANLLCKRMPDSSIELVPIDHGYCLRDVCDVSWMDWCWLDWEAVKQPLSEKSKRYILNLDVDAEAELLKERLNIGGRAIDYFRASSKLLQEGVKAGLTLYDIAIMCCRNDNMGEIPSKLEVLTSMASELATVAVDNGKWNPVAASNALAEQLLSPEGGSLLHPQSQESSISFFKSASSLNLVPFGVERSANFGRSDVPAMTQSTGSDTSSDEDAAMDRDECEEWAADVVANVSLSMVQPYDKPRTSSISCSEHSSDTNLSSSPKGFWLVKPGSSPDEDSDSFELRSTDGVEGEESFLSPVNTTLHAGGFLLPPPATVNVSTYKKTSGLSNSISFASLKKKSSSISRSHSISSFSELRRLSSTMSTNSGETAPRPPVSEDEKYRRYFAKFVDLVVVRETTAIACLGSGVA